MKLVDLFVVFFVATLLAFGAPPHARADDRDFSGTVTRIFDGDSFLVRPQRGRDVDVRLIDIDAPEKGQPHADRSRAAVERLIGSRAVFVDVIDTDQYGRKLARVYREPDRLDVTRTLVHDGHVWVYRRTARDQALFKLEDAAKASRSGLWSLPAHDRMPPWRFRYLERQRKKGVATENTKKK
jgi:endonuclease YncB( thermonuclease family)